MKRNVEKADSVQPESRRKGETMLLREDLERREYSFLSDFATKSAESKGRMLPETSCDVRTEFQRDRDRIRTRY